MRTLNYRILGPAMILLAVSACSGSFVFNEEYALQANRREVPNLAPAGSAPTETTEIIKSLAFTLNPAATDATSTATLSRDDALGILFKGVKVDPFVFANHGDNFEVVMGLRSSEIFVDESKHIYENHADMNFELKIRENNEILASRKFKSVGFVVLSNKDNVDLLQGQIVSVGKDATAQATVPTSTNTAPVPKKDEVHLYIYLVRDHAATAEEAKRNSWHGGTLRFTNADGEFRLGTLESIDTTASAAP